MIAVMLHDMRWRFLLIAAIAVLLYFMEPGFHQHEGFDPTAVALGPVGVSATLSYLAALTMIALMAGTISTDRREGHTRLLFAQPTSPLAYYGLRWGLAYGLAIVFASAFLFFGQLIAWGEFLGGWSGLILPVLSALVFGGLAAFLTAALPRGDAFVLFLLFLPTLVPPEIVPIPPVQALSGLLDGAPIVRYLLPPQTALADIWQGLLLDAFDWGAVVFAASYGLLFLLAGAALVRLREWP